MTDNATTTQASMQSSQPRDTRRQLADAARQWTLTVIASIARETATPMVTRPAWPGARSTFEYAEPAAGIAIARQLEVAARYQVRRYIKHAREAGLSWQQIGAALGITGGGDGVAQAIAEAAFDYAAGPTDNWRGYDQSFAWTCQACGQGIQDRGPYHGPRDAERGHADGCEHQAATVAAWDAQWAADDDDPGASGPGPRPEPDNDADFDRQVERGEA